MVFISTSLSPLCPSTSITSPTGLFRSSSGHCTILTRALSSVFPPFIFFLGMMILCENTSFCGTRYAISLSTFNLPTNVSLALSRTSITCASLIWLVRRAMKLTLTLSPLSAPMELRSATKMGLPPSAGKKEFLPLSFLTNVPSCTCPLVLSLYELSDVLTR